MASNESTDQPAATGSSDAPVLNSPPKYVPQFSATTEMILKRINSGASSSLSSMGITGMPPGYEDMRRNVLQGMKTSMNMEMPATPVGGRRSSAKTTTSANTGGVKAAATPGSGKGKGAAKGKSRAGTKRKRVKEQESMSEEESEDENMSKLGEDTDTDGSLEVTELPKITQSGRQIVKPQQFVPQVYETSTKRRAPSRKSQEYALCKRCGRGHSPATNMIVFCDGCNNGWHQQCHDPPVSDEAVQDEKSSWYCVECSRKKGIALPEPTPKGVSWAGKSTEEKRAYLSSLPQPQLVTLLLQATNLHPSLPIYPAAAPAPNARPAHKQPTAASSTPFPPSAASAAGLFSRADANPSAPMNFIRKVQSPGLSQSQSSQGHSSSAPPTLPPQSQVNGAGEDSRESSPNSPPYPKAGTGLMSKLGPDNEDLEWLEDAGGSDAFSHMLFPEAAAQDVAGGAGGAAGVAFGNGVMGVGV